MTEVALAKLPVVVATNSIHQMVILVIRILPNYDCMIIATTNTYNLYVVFDIAQNHLWLTNVDLSAIAKLTVVVVATGVEVALFRDEAYGLAAV